jgi:hypothetical protein
MGELDPRGIGELEAEGGIRGHEEVRQVHADEPAREDGDVERPATGIVPSQIEVELGVA